jgi:hypothetical protein
MSDTDENLDQRRLDLDDWVRELCLDEKSMSNPRVEALLNEFLEVGQQAAPLEPSNHLTTDVSEWVVIPSNTVTTFNCKCLLLSPAHSLSFFLLVCLSIFDYPSHYTHLITHLLS